MKKKSSPMSKEVKYNSWPLGKLPKELQRPELDQLKEAGYTFEDPMDVVDIFEKKVAALSDSPFAVAVDCCSHAIFLSIQYELKYNPDNIADCLTIPAHTYVSVPMQISEAGLDFKLEPREWKGAYKLKGSRIVDSAGRFTKGMYIKGTLQCLSFQIKKRLPIGRGGMILTDDPVACEYLKRIRHDGRNMNLPYTHKDHITGHGYHMYMTPEDAARGILLMDMLPEQNEDSQNNTMYPDLRVWQT
jgi:dTDP-4-amino-4,6-dideoxygalactose transaminase